MKQVTHRITEWLRLKGRHLVKAFAQVVTQNSLAQDCVQMTLEYPQGWRLCNLSGQPMSVLSHPRNQKEFPGVWGEPHRMGQFERDCSRSCGPAALLKKGHPRAHGKEPPVFPSVAILVLTHWKEPGCVLFAPFSQVFINTDEIPPNLFSRRRSSSCLSLSLQVRCSCPFNSLMAIYQIHVSSPMLRSSEPHTQLYKSHFCPSACI